MKKKIGGSPFSFGSLVVLVEVAMEKEWMVEEEVAVEEWMVEEEVAMEEEWMVEEEVVVEAEATMEATETEGLCLLVCYYWT